MKMFSPHYDVAEGINRESASLGICDAVVLGLDRANARCALLANVGVIFIGSKH